MIEQWIDSLVDWIRDHERFLDGATLWTLAVGFTVLALVKLVTWGALRDQRDQTSVGRALKSQKMSEALAWGAMSSLYWLSLWMYHGSHTFGFWERVTIRVVVMVGLSGAVVYGLLFVAAFHREVWALPETQDAQHIRNIRQDAREVSQASRDVRQEERSVILDTREIAQGERELRIDERDANGAS